MLFRRVPTYALLVVLAGLLAIAVLVATPQPALSYPNWPIASIRATDSVASEWGPDLGEFTISLSFPAKVPLTIYYTVVGTAKPNADYMALDDHVTIPAGANRAVLLVIPRDDAKAEGDKTVVVTLRSGPGYMVESRKQATVTIADDDLQIRTSENPIGNPWRYLWDPLSGKLFQGPNATGNVVVFFDIDRHQGEGRIHLGPNVTGEILFTVDFRNGRIWAGPNKTGPLMFTLEMGRSGRGPNVRVHRGDAKGPIIYTINDDDLFTGPRVRGQLVSHGSRSFWGPIQFLLPLVAEALIP